MTCTRTVYNVGTVRIRAHGVRSEGNNLDASDMLYNKKRKKKHIHFTIRCKTSILIIIRVLYT